MKVPRLFNKHIAKKTVSPDKIKLYQRFSKEAYSKTPQNMGDYRLDTTLSNDEEKVYVNPITKQVTIAYRGTDWSDKRTRFKDLKSDLAILMGKEAHNDRFREANAHFQKVYQKYGKEYQLDTTGHSLGGQLSKYVNDKNRGKVQTNVAFSRGTGLWEPFRKKQANTLDVSHEKDWISLGARLQGGNQMTSRKKVTTTLDAHDLKNLGYQ